MAYLCVFSTTAFSALGRGLVETEKHMKEREMIMNNIWLFQQIIRLQDILSQPNASEKLGYKQFNSELNYYLKLVAQDEAASRDFEQIKRTIGVNDHPEEVISEDIQNINRQLVDLIAQIQNAEPAPHRKTVEDGYYDSSWYNGIVFRDFHMDEIHKMIALCQQAYDIQKSVQQDGLTLVPVLSIKKLKDKYKENFGWNTVLCDFIGVFVKG